MKRSLAILCFLVLAVSACKKEDELSEFVPEFEVFVLFPTEGIGDRSFVDGVYEGIEKTVQTVNFKVNYIIPDSLEAGEQWIQDISELKSDISPEALVIIVGSQYTSALESINGHFGKHFVLGLETTASAQDRLFQVTFHTYASSYVSGYISAQKASPCKALVVAGFDAPFLTEYIQGFNQGVADAGGTVSPPQFLSTGFSGFEMPDSAYRFTNNLLPDHNLLFALSSGSNQGIINAARDFPKQRYVVGVDADQSWMGLTVVTGSVIKRFDKVVFDCIEQFSSGNLNSGNVVLSMDDGSTDFWMNEVVMENTQIPEELIKTAIEKEKEFILSSGGDI
ncbi:BMP family ABC transporter substrate-binding protein [Thermophagus sp. OGC60D27]|uniref:BMP family ABC transporter substrate-binding protein n=1 Tax=Thermophagus sp. OGC60D27 TaxID=3458415 RepID=UPI0040377598